MFVRAVRNSRHDSGGSRSLSYSLIDIGYGDELACVGSRRHSVPNKISFPSVIPTEASESERSGRTLGFVAELRSAGRTRASAPTRACSQSWAGLEVIQYPNPLPFRALVHFPCGKILVFLAWAARPLNEHAIDR